MSRLDIDLIDSDNKKPVNELDNPFLNNSGIIKNSEFKFNKHNGKDIIKNLPQNINKRDRKRAMAKKKCEICNLRVINGLDGEN